MNRRSVLVFALSTAIGIAACGTHTKSVKFSTTKFAGAEAISVADQARLDANCPDGAPKPLPDWPIGQTEMIYHDGFRVLRTPLCWAASATPPRYIRTLRGGGYVPAGAPALGFNAKATWDAMWDWQK